MLALASDQLANSIFAGGSNGSGSGDAKGGGDSPAGSAPLHIRRAVARLGPNFVKIGQALASRPDLVGEAIAGELLLLQDAMPFFSHEIAREFIREVSPWFARWMVPCACLWCNPTTSIGEVVGWPLKKNPLALVYAYVAWHKPGS